MVVVPGIPLRMVCGRACLCCSSCSRVLLPLALPLASSSPAEQEEEEDTPQASATTAATSGGAAAGALEVCLLRCVRASAATAQGIGLAKDLVSSPGGRGDSVLHCKDGHQQQQAQPVEAVLPPVSLDGLLHRGRNS